MPAETRARMAVEVQVRRVREEYDVTHLDRELTREEKQLAHAALTNTPMIGVPRPPSGIQTYADLIQALAFVGDALSDQIVKKDAAQAALAALESDVAATRRVLGIATTIGA